MRKKVLILSESFGLGHTNAAEALAERILLMNPTVEIKIMELGKQIRPFLSTCICYTYIQMITKLPTFWKKMYKLNENKPISYWLQFLIYYFCHRKIVNIINDTKPDLIICTHPFSSSSVSRLKKYGCPIKLCTAITDFEAHGTWIQPEVDLYLVSTNFVKNKLVKMGISKSQIIVAGVPIKSNFLTKKDKQEIRKELQLKQLPTVLLMGGGLGLGELQERLLYLLKWKNKIQIVICTGLNKSLKHSLSKNSKFIHPNVHILGFVNNIDKWMDASDLLITKAGGVTCFEALFKGLPMLLDNPIPGHEEENCNYLVKNNLAIRIYNTDEIDLWIQKILFYPQEIKNVLNKVYEFQKSINPNIGIKSILKLMDLHI